MPRAYLDTVLLMPPHSPLSVEMGTVTFFSTSTAARQSIGQVWAEAQGSEGTRDFQTYTTSLSAQLSVLHDSTWSVGHLVDRPAG